MKILNSTWANHKLVHKGVFILREVVAMEPPEHLKVYPDIIVGCGHPNDRDQMTCRVTELFRQIVNDYRPIPWTFNADDDTWFDLDLLFEYLINLQGFLDPMRHLVFKAHANMQMGSLSMVHGGSGWLMSRAWMEFCQEKNYTLINFNPWARYRQPDTAQSIIVRQLFKNDTLWDEYYFPGFEYKYCHEPNMLSGSFANIQPCNDFSITYGRLNSLIVLHTIGLKLCNWEIATRIGRLPPPLLFYRVDERQDIQLCWETGSEVIASYTRADLRGRTPVWTADDMIPIDYSTLIDENETLT